MVQPIAYVFRTGTPYDGYLLLILLTIVAISLAAIRWRFFVQWLHGIRGRDWPAVSAAIDIVTVIPQITPGRGGQQIDGYIATLTYFYRNPELQSGEYSRMFDNEADAKDWAGSYKGSAVTVHVDPRDPSRSVLRAEAL